MEQELSIIQLIIHASIVVQIVIGILVIFSIISWGIIFGKWVTLAKVKLDTYLFLRNFQNDNNLSNIFNSLQHKTNVSAVPAVFKSGIQEYNKLKQDGISDTVTILANVERALTSAIDEQIGYNEKHLSILATFGSVSPYIGLFGTVWGIMHAFIGLGTTGQSTLALVAPGIAEALIATAIGLFVAIPAYIFYNKFTNDAQILTSKMYKFGDDFLNIINRRLVTTNNKQNES